MNLTLLGTFLMSGLSVGAIYALSGVGLVLLYKASNVLNFAYGAIGGVSAMACWQVIQWGSPDPVAWLVALMTGGVLSFGYGRYLAPLLAYREPVVKAVANPRLRPYSARLHEPVLGRGATAHGTAH